MQDGNYKNVIEAFISKINDIDNMDSSTLVQIQQVLNSTLSQLEQSALMLKTPSQMLAEKNILKRQSSLPPSGRIACQGVEGAYSHIAAKSIFNAPDITFYTHFEDVVKAVAEEKMDFGVLPVENSSAGSVEEVIELVCKYNCYINKISPIKIEHYLCASENASFEKIQKVYSHPQALMQSSQFLKENNLEKVATSNTAVAAQKMASEKLDNQACLCSALSAEIYGLKILKKGVQNQRENYTRFICISKEALVLDNARTVSVALSFPNQPGALSSLLTMFSVFNLDLSKIQSMPIGGADFNVRFHLDFTGNIDDSRVENLLGQMYSLYDDFQFLGNY